MRLNRTWALIQTHRCGRGRPQQSSSAVSSRRRTSTPGSRFAAVEDLQKSGSGDHPVFKEGRPARPLPPPSTRRRRTRRGWVQIIKRQFAICTPFAELRSRSLHQSGGLGLGSDHGATADKPQRCRAWKPSERTAVGTLVLCPHSRCRTSCEGGNGYGDHSGRGVTAAWQKLWSTQPP